MNLTTALTFILLTFFAIRAKANETEPNDTKAQANTLRVKIQTEEK